GTPETNGVPLHYWLQGLWQCAVTGLRDVVFVVLGPFLELTEYWVTYTDFDIEMTVDTIGEFVATLPGGVWSGSRSGRIRPRSGRCWLL
ncbi:hypothetical protein ACPXAM_23585, partial [Escherichia coli]|uniref:hypothetical protein n=1 Tax=Escherichia coli TaxID=562 RepID=UPI003CE4BBC8